MITLTTSEFQLLSSLIEKECGIALQDDKQYLIESRLANLLIENGCNTFSEFYQKAKSNLHTDLKDKIVDAITTNETLWFRDDGPYTVLKEKLFPEYLSNNQVCRIWSAACSTGQEPYSIIISAYEASEKLHKKQQVDKLLSVMASDISSSALMLAKNARYNAIAMSRGMPADLKVKYFEDNGPVSVLKDDVKKLVTFQKFNLQQPFDAMGKFDIIFLRNVAIYFSQEFKVELFKKLAKALKPGGYLFIGASETLMGYSEDFKLLEYNKSRYYQVKSE